MLIGLHQAGLLSQAIVSSCKTALIPRELITQMGFPGRVQKRLSLYDPSGWLVSYLENRIFDRWANRVTRPARIFSSWTGMCLTSLQAAQRRGSHTFLGLGSAHPRTVLELINHERRQWGLKDLRETPHIRQIEQELALTDIIMTQSRFSERTLVERGLPAAKIVTLPLGVNVERFRPAGAIPTEPFRVLFLGQIMLRKGIQYLLEAWHQLGWGDAELWLVGKVMPDSQPVLKHYADLPGLRLMGYIPDQLAALQNAYAFVMPSVEDGFGLGVTEAMACGLPVIVSDHVGAADLVREGDSGFIVPYDNVTGYAAALETLRANSARARQMGQAGRAAVLNQTWNDYRQRLVNLYLTA
jgi:glycosyltransferase involved in cell wall biosynthesis